jgi:GH18 family chitinase
MPWYRVSHVDIAFADATVSSLTFGASQDMYLAAFVTAAHNAGAKVLVSIGGAGAGSTQVASLYVPATVDAFVTTIAAYLDAQNLDGIDVDVEGDPVNGNYAGFIDKLVAKVRPKGKLVTSALAQWFGNNIAPATYAQFDFVNVMSYDKCGNAPCEHSTYDAAVRDLDYFKAKGVTSDKMVLGVPFYCHCWGATCAASQVAYAQVLAKFPGGMDYIQSNGITYSCNGPATIQKKAGLAQGYGGMMAWEITQDAGGDQSLLKVMADNL